MPRSFASRLAQFPPRAAAGCPTCRAWSWRVVNDTEPSPYDVEQRRGEPPGPGDWPAVCPDCGRAIPTISIVHVAGDEWRGRRL